MMPVSEVRRRQAISRHQWVTGNRPGFAKKDAKYGYACRLLWNWVVS